MSLAAMESHFTAMLMTHNCTHTSAISPISSPSSTLPVCLEEIRVWMKHNFLQLNSSKTEAILLGTPHQTQSSSITGITISDHDIPLSTTVTNLGVRFDPQLSFEAHIKNLCKTSFYHLRNIAKLHWSMPLSPPDWITVTHFSLGSLTKACRDCSMFRIVLLGSWWEFENTITSHPFSIHFTGFLFPPGLNIRSPF